MNVKIIQRDGTITYMVIEKDTEITILSPEDGWGYQSILIKGEDFEVTFDETKRLEKVFDDFFDTNLSTS